MNKEEYKKAYEKATEDIRKAEEELDSLLKMAKLKEEELDERRENLLVNLMEMDKNTINEEEEEEPSSEFTFVGETPNPSDLVNRKSIVLHFKPFADNSEMKSEDVAIALERGVDYESATAALMFALIETTIKSVNDSSGKDDVLEGINKSRVAVKTLTDLAENLLEEENDGFIEKLMKSIFENNEEDEEEDDD